MSFDKYKTKRGWYNKRPNSNPEYESYRHRLARYGIKTTGLTNQEIKQEHELLMKKLGKDKKKERFVQHKPKKADVNDDNLVNYLIQHESGELTNEEFFQLFGFLVKTGRVWNMQGSYGRQAKQLMDMNYINPNGSVNWNKIQKDGIKLKEVG